MPKEKSSQEELLERERRHVNRDEDPSFDPTDKLPGDKIPGADQMESKPASKKAPA